jgi:hypothetical protein
MRVEPVHSVEMANARALRISRTCRRPRAARTSQSMRLNSSHSVRIATAWAPASASIALSITLTSALLDCLQESILYLSMKSRRTADLHAATAGGVSAASPALRRTAA